MDRHLSSLGVISDVTNTLIDEFLDGVSSPQESTLFSVLSPDEIFKFEGSSTTDNAGSFTETWHVKRDSSLSLRHQEEIVHLL